MLNAIFHAHSGLRYLILIIGVITLIVQALGVYGRQFYGRPSRIAMAVFTGMLDLQLLLGVVMAALGCFYPALMGHLMMMVIAIALVHACSVFARKQLDGRRAHIVALVGVVLGLALICGGIAAIGRSPFGSSGAPTCTAAHGRA
jgi:hypothetical protein